MLSSCPCVSAAQEGGEVRCGAHEATAGPVDCRIHIGDVLPLEIVGRDMGDGGVPRRCSPTMCQLMPAGSSTRSRYAWCSGCRVSDSMMSPASRKPVSVYVRAVPGGEVGGGLAAAKFDEIERREPPATVAVAHRVQDRRAARSSSVGRWCDPGAVAA